MKADFTGSVKPGSELAPPLTDDIACLGLIGSVLTSRIQVVMKAKWVSKFMSIFIGDNLIIFRNIDLGQE